MTALAVDIGLYRRLTGDNDTDPGAVAAALEVAEQVVGEELRRPLAAAERTERLRVRAGRVWPTATPVVSAAGYTIEGAGLVVSGVWDAWSPSSDEQWVQVTYTGGWTPETIPRAVATEVVRIARAWLLASADATPTTGEVNAEGDADLGTPPVVPVLTVDPITPDRRALRPWRRARI